MKQLVGVDLTAADGVTEQKFKLGDLHEDDHGTVYMYAQASGAVTANRFVTIDYSVSGDAQAAQGTTTTAGSGPILGGVAMATLADDEFGWFAIGPISPTSGVSVFAAASCAADVTLNTTATAGLVDDSSTTAIPGFALVSAVGSGGSAVTPCYATKRLAIN